MLARELRAAPVDNADVGAAAWAGGVVAKGEVPFVPSFARGRWANMGCFYVNGDDEKTGMGVAYACEFAVLCVTAGMLVMLIRCCSSG